MRSGRTRCSKLSGRKNKFGSRVKEEPLLIGSSSARVQKSGLFKESQFVTTCPSIHALSCSSRVLSSPAFSASAEKSSRFFACRPIGRALSLQQAPPLLPAAAASDHIRANTTGGRQVPLLLPLLSSLSSFPSTHTRFNARKRI